MKHASRPRRQLLADTVRDQIMDRIDHGSLTIGAKLPAEPELCTQFEVSRATIREAVRGLVEEGYLSRIHGSGTYVAFRPDAPHSLERNLSYTTLISNAGFKPGLDLLALTVSMGSVDELRRLGLGDGAEILRVERVRSADELPVIYSIDAMSAAVVDGVPLDDFSDSLYALLDGLGRSVAHAEATLVPTLAEDIHQQALGVALGSPLLHIDQIDYTAEGEAVMYSREWHVPGVFALTLLRRPS